jgi:TetR/AcrR family transcriptional repressor of nem operon
MAAIQDDDARAAAIADYKRRYLSEKARDTPAARCPMVALGTDVSRQPGPVRRVYAAGLRRYLDAFARALGGRGTARRKAKRQEAIATLAMLAGALSLARSVAEADPELSDEILAAAAARLPESED